MLKKIKAAVFLVILFIGFIFSGISFAHEGHADGLPGAGTVIGGVINLSQEARENIGLKVVEAEERAIDEVVKVNGKIISIPDRQAHISSRISGRVLKLLVNLGDEVQADQELVKIESRQIGDPPPWVILKSPLAGTVIDRDVVLGEAVEPDKHLLEIANLEEVLVECEIYEEDISRVKIKQKTRVYLPVAYPGKSFAGEVSYVSATLDPDTRAAHLWIQVPNRERIIKPGMLAEAGVIIQERLRAIAVPREAVMEEGAEKFVYLETGENAFKRQSVVLGISSDREIEIKKGLIPGDRIVANGSYELRMTELTAIKKVK